MNNAGIGAQGTIETNSIDEWQRVFDVNVFGIVRVESRAAMQHLRSSPHAAIVNTCSICATAGLPERALYSATKGAVMSLTFAMAADHLREGRPGQLREPRHRRHARGSAGCSRRRPTPSRSAPHSRRGNRRVGSCLRQEVADAILYLASPSASATTGMALAVDGGMQGVRLRPRTP